MRARRAVLAVLVLVVLCAVGIAIGLRRSGPPTPAEPQPEGAPVDVVGPPPAAVLRAPPRRPAPTPPAPAAPATTEPGAAPSVEGPPIYGHAIGGRVVDAMGGAVAGALVFVAPSWNPPWVLIGPSDGKGTAPRSAAATTDGEGRYRLPLPDPGPYTIVAFTPSRAPDSAALSIGVGSAPTVRDLVLTSGVAIAGHVSQVGLPVPGAVVAAAWYGATDSETYPQDCLARSAGEYVVVRAETRTDRDGRFTLEGLGPGPWRVRVRKPEWDVPLHPIVAEAVDRLTRAPAYGVDFDVAAGPCAFTVETRARGGTSAPVLEWGGDVPVRMLVGPTTKIALIVPMNRAFPVTLWVPGSPPRRSTSPPGGVPARGPRYLSWVPTRVGRDGAEEPPKWPKTVATSPLRVTGPDREPLTGRFRLLDAGGFPVHVSFVGVGELSEVSLWTVSPDRLTAPLSLLLEPAPPAGTYSLEWQVEGFDPPTATLTVPWGSRAPDLVLRAH